MTTRDAPSSAETAPPTSILTRVGYLAYGLAAYVAFLVVFLWAIAFVENASIVIGGAEIVPRTIDRGGPSAWVVTALAIDLGLLTLFAAQHSVMARAGLKQRWTRIVPTPIERSTYVAAATACLAAVLWWWHPITATVWDVSAPAARTFLVAVSLFGWVLVLTSTFLINHFDLFGLRQVVANAKGRTLEPYRFITPLWYGIVRHPIYLGFLIAFWVAPTMTVGHLLFACATTGYVLLGIHLEERDLIRSFGDDYIAYRGRVPMLLPGTHVRRSVRSREVSVG
ncbi:MULTISPECIES: methanethiol S-methyltransferase [Gordonia]|uniref:methanethiol S-methyltransferase n=1 Tax=Gordonia TaxID=2053 RepID=UPI00041D9B79|nr:MULTISPECIES: methanethiol S-methyltransferase [Gordonia]KAF0967762.1 Methanethiol S-methyltransferase 1 [Gordonia sp. YY1]MCR8896573.1 isoprenylcysteine carboxylmethyltransferase family protein [Gordonia sp. GONU]MCZ0913860.1 isoprenylcysteine carboxylmethyltransferase family protein [Gordonia amicalis]MCZ4650436.1 isoprenylcysteine carboxylmethyltransferase family protein [Gordonia amicalis]